MKPSLWKFLKLRCGYCGVTPLLSQGHWFKLAKGCPACNYSFEREPGYFTGASWMIMLPTSSTLSFLLCGALLISTELSAESVIGIGTSFLLAISLGAYPYFIAIWLRLDHGFHPIDKYDSYQNK